MGDWSIELEWLAQDGTPLATPAKYTLTIRFGHVDCKTTSSTPLVAVFYSALGIQISNPYDVASHYMDRNVAYDPALMAITLSPNWCKLIVSYTSTGID